MSNVLIVGGDSFLAKELAPELSRIGFEVTCTTRKFNDKRENFIYLDLLKPNSFPKLKFDIAILLAGIWDYQECAQNPLARQVNIDNMSVLAKQLSEQGTFVTFISSNTVFGGQRPWCNEDSPQSPLFPYAEHKSLSEQSISEKLNDIDRFEQFNIIRLTKILGPQTSPLPNWFSSIKKEEVFTPFEDLVFAPISVQYASKYVSKIAVSKISGSFHLSGRENLNYYQFAKLLCEATNSKSSLIAPTKSLDCGVNIPFLPTYSGLGMKHTSKAFGIEPQPINDVIIDVLSKEISI